MRFVGVSIFLCSVAAVAGCQRYAPSPLDLGAHARSWSARDVASPDVVQFGRELSAARAGAVVFDPSDGLSIEEAEAVALFFNSAVRQARAKARVATAGAAEAGRWEDPRLTIDAERILQSVEHPWVIGGMIGLTLPLSGRLGVEKRGAEAEADVERLRAYAAERTMLGELREQWLRWSAIVLKVKLAESLIGDVDAVLAAAEKLRDAGEIEPTSARLLRIERVTRAGKLRELRARVAEQEAAVKATLGLAADARVALAPMESLPVDVAERTPTEGLAHPRVAVAAAEYEVAERNLELAIRKQYPDLDLGGGFGKDEGTDRILFGLGVPLPVFNANRREIATAAARREAARVAAEAEFEGVAAEIARARLELAARVDRADYVEKELAPLVDRQLDDVRKLGRAGDYNALLLLESLQASHDAKLELLDARLEAAEAASRLRSLLETAPKTTARPVEVKQ